MWVVEEMAIIHATMIAQEYKMTPVIFKSRHCHDLD
jgi:hypothetical protein